MNREGSAEITSGEYNASRKEAPVRIYSPRQVACGTIGGPVGLMYFLMANFDALGQPSRKNRVLNLGILFILALIIILPLLPEDMSSVPFTTAYIAIAYYVAERYQMNKQQIKTSEDYEFHSNWRVLGLGLLCLVGSVIAIMGPLMLLVMTGIWVPA